MISTVHTPCVPSSVTALHDLWQAEEQLAWALDAWLIDGLRAFPQVDSRSVAAVRRQFTAARFRLRTRILTHGRAVAHVPFVCAEEAPETHAGQLRRLQALHARFRQRSRGLEHTLRRLTEAGSYVEVNLVRDLLDAHDAARALFQEAFAAGAPDRMSVAS